MKKRILNWFGIYLKKDYIELQHTHDKIAADLILCKRANNSHRFFIDQLKKKIKTYPFDFGSLIVHYNKNQLNALIYEAINYARNKEEFRELLERWKLRIINGQETLKEDLNGKKAEILCRLGR